MEKISNFPLIFFFIITIVFCLINNSLSTRICKPSSCSEMGPEIRFPFYLKGKQNDNCGYPGFDLSCNNQSKTILTLPISGDFEISRINYFSQSIFINDPESCLPKRISNFKIQHFSQFKPSPSRNYDFFNCSSNSSIGYYMDDRAVHLSCIENMNYTIVATNSRFYAQDLPPSCVRMPNVSVPIRPPYYNDEYWSWSSRALSEDIELVWDEPNCRRCELRQQFCGFSSNSETEIGCSAPSRRGLSRSAKYGVILGAGIPGIVCIIGLVCYAGSRIRTFSLRNNVNNITNHSNSAINPPRSITITGLDSHTIESYPKTVLGESKRLPKPSDDGTCCPICLSDYQPKETLRTIPECNHYFHADCIDEWLMLNGTCPLCRKAPESINVTPCSSVSSVFSSSTSTT